MTGMFWFFGTPEIIALALVSSRLGIPHDKMMENIRRVTDDRRHRAYLGVYLRLTGPETLCDEY